MPPLSRLLPGLVVFWLAGTLFAQTPRVQPPPSHELRLLAWSALPPGLQIGTGAKTQTLALTTSEFTLLPHPPGAAKFEIHTTVKDPEGRDQKIPYATADWPAGFTAAIGILIPNPNAPPPTGLLYLVPDDRAAHPEHTARFINLTNSRFLLAAGGQTAELPPRAEMIAPFKPEAERLRADLAQFTDGAWARVLGTNLAVAGRHRLFAFIRTSANPEPGAPANQPAISLIFDRTSSPAPARGP
jgi:hypothetical protein